MALALATLTLSAPAGAAPPPPAPTGGSILDEMAAVVTAEHQPSITSAQQSLAQAQAALGAARTREAGDQALVAQAYNMTARAASAVASDTTALAADTSARDAAAAAVATDRLHLQAIGVELYVGPQVVPVATPDGLAEAQAQEFATEVIDIGTGNLIADLHHHQSDQAADAKEVRADTGRLGDDRASLARDTTLRDHRAVLLAQDQASVSSAAAGAAAAQATLDNAQASLAQAVAGVANPPGMAADGSPSIVGTSALDQAQIVGWYDAEGWADLTPAPVDQLAGWYLSEGAAEGVRGDVAFAQAMVETAGFSSNDAVTLNNYAGVGHCDACGSGLAFGSPQLGVRGQIQLLHSFADAALTAAQLARPLAVAVLTPQTQPDRGCCGTWQSLTGKWASDPLYGHTIMGVYQRMVDYALAHPQG